MAHYSKGQRNWNDKKNIEYVAFEWENRFYICIGPETVSFYYYYYLFLMCRYLSHKNVVILATHEFFLIFSVDVFSFDSDNGRHLDL